MQRYGIFVAALLAAAVIIEESRAFDEPIRALPAGRKLADQRLQPLKDLNGYFPFTPPKSQREWSRRSARFRQRTLTAVGLWPMPERGDLNTVIHGRVERDDYTVERVYFTSLAGFHVTGSLFRPKSPAPEGGRPGILCPHGHWRNGRFHDAGEAQAKSLIDAGAEERINAARFHLQARCVQLARMGCTVFHYDMIGYADSQQISYGLAHGFAKQRPALNSPKRYGLFSPQAESNLQSVMALQTYNSIRALDFLESLPDVDSKRLAVTGASGGGTQSFILAALDPRVVTAVPAVMVSTAMQGGCTCENCSLLRVDEGNIAFAGLFAPKPLGLTAANDWTKEMAAKGFPELKALYGLLGAEDNVALLNRTEFGHNYNLISRRFMYSWFNKHLKLGLEEPIRERDFQPLTVAEMTVYNDEHRRPAGGEKFEVGLLHRWSEDTRRQIAARKITDAESARAYRQLVGEGIDGVIGRGLPDPKSLAFEQTAKADRGTYLAIGGLVANTDRKEEIPLLFLFPKNWKNRVAIWLSEQGKSGLAQADGQPIAGVQQLLDAGVAVVGVDLHRQGEAGDGKPVTETRKVNNSREAAAYTLGYNRSLFAKRVHDVLTSIAFVRNHEYRPQVVDLVALDSTGPIAAAARAQARTAVDHAAIETGKFRFLEVKDIRDPQLLPGGAKYDDLPGMLAVAAPAKLWLAGESPESAPVVRDAYRATDGTLSWGEGGEEAAASWLLKQ